MAQSNFAVNRRTVLRAALAAGITLPISGALASCAGGGSSGGSGGQSTGKTSASNPFGMPDKSTVDAVIFNGGYGTDYVTFAGKIVEKDHAGSTVKVSPSTQISQQLQPRFVSGNPPDLIDDSGAQSIGVNTIASQLEDLAPVLEANNLEGTKIADTLYPGVKERGMVGDKMLVLNYVMTIYGLWYSASLFEANGWQPPKTWDDLIDLGGKAKSKGKYLFCWGKEAATYYQTLVMDSAIKEGGDEVRLALENLKPGCWSLPAVQGVLKKLEQIVKAGYVKPGGAGTQFTAAQAQWSKDESAILYPSGSWIENEMKSQTKPGFKMTGIPDPTLTASSKMPFEALNAAPGEQFIVPTKAKNPAGGKEVLRTMLSKDSATNFAKTKLAPTIVKGTVPSDGFGSTALQSQIKMLDAAGDKVFNIRFVDLYGTNQDMLVPWNSFLSGQLDAAGLTKALQGITDKVAKDSSVKKVEIK
ncbi:carbohydrate ABC transporter, N-acetylglucosamine/diacetylchitobiose-binding protein [Flexivirga sp. ID2601S]|uniref:Carbohydrate ABC transporter, N-acetylglucosamine/diacetylchitobiose-binding protein n=1 Tax=Flexivirga aerilata TaxID=1656889 RepID=A0A849ASN0_9MICO|nr:N-acetylglucosamine/diacetylchitobiose ABC transporter substrate-binding protein [Flexivirga aerilata]NNG39732.1 carbohydrate ABC transporter, N-acetylglucosamine/diacetylchitobiose-binding protein [Flexivirga aerilata]